ncbi:TPA: hypothetical protein ACIJ22_003453 [Pseudomonas aeruginosa]
MNKANECTCPSGDGSLVHPCPTHPAAEQAGGDERAAFEAWMTWLMDHVYGRLPDFTLDDGSGAHYVNADVSYAWTAWQARAALAQPSPAHAEQAEAERPEVVARAVHSNPVVLGQCGPLNANDELMTVAQHAASVARWAEMFNRVEQQRDAALARVAGLELGIARIAGDFLPDNSGQAELALDEMRQALHELLAAAPTQAQHSVPEGLALIPVRETEAMHDAVMALLYKGVARTDTQKLLDAYIAAAPGKEGV